LAERYWLDLKNRRKFFEDYAKANNFDPLQKKYWYAQHVSQLNKFKVLGMIEERDERVRVERGERGCE
jgi:hypothetical protein